MDDEGRILEKSHNEGATTSCQFGTCKEIKCLNGACTKLLNEHVYDNYRTCNENKDCK